jgi:RNA polymerase sigma-70 factor (ECF subfamily)
MRLVSSLVPNQAQAEDIVQETFIRAFRSMHQFRGDMAFYTWLYCIGINTAKSVLVSKKPARLAPDIHTSMDDKDVFEQYETAELNESKSDLISKQLPQPMRSSIDQLPFDWRTVLLLREIEGLSYREIAHIMECPIGTVRSRIFRAREFIAERLKPMVGP